MHMFRRGLLSAAIVLGVGVVLAAQAAIGPTDLARLETTAADVDRQIRVLDSSDPTLGADVRKSLIDLRDDIAYLRVKLRRDGSVSTSEFGEVRDRLETLRVRAQGSQKVTAQPVSQPDRAYTVPVGTELDVRLQSPLTSRTARLEQRFEATTVLDLTQGPAILIPAGSVVRGFVSSVRPAGRLDRTGSLTLSFDELVIGQHVTRLRASVVKALDPKISDDAGRIGTGALVGAILGGVLGGGKGALIGVLIGGGGTIASTEGSDVDLPVGTLLRLRIDQPVEIWTSPPAVP